MALRYWRGGTGSWTTSNTANWSTTSGGSVDAVARTVAPTTAPGTAGINDYEFTCSYNPPS
jgi:hypothetical protein